MTPDTEHKPHPVSIFVNNNPVEMPDDNTTGEAIKQKADVPLDFTLYLKRGDNLEEITNEQPIKIHEREEFIAVSGQDVSER